MVAAAGALAAAGWLLNALAESLALLYLAEILAGVGGRHRLWGLHRQRAEMVPPPARPGRRLYRRRFGAGSALTVLPISNMIRDHGYEAAFLWFGLGQGVVVVLAALVQREPMGGGWRVEGGGWRVKDGESNPPPELIPSPITHRPPPASLPPHLADFTWQQMLRTPIFWLMYLMLTMISVGGLMAVAQLGPMARRYGVEDVPVTLLGFTAAALPFALTLERVMNGVTRPFFGWVSDHLGRENTMFVAFGLEGVAILLLINLAHIPILFVLLIGLTFFAWGEAFSLFPALCGDVFGPRFATTNYGLLYTAKGLASLLVPVGSLISEATGSWRSIFMLAIAFDWTAALLALLVLKPMRSSPIRLATPPPSGNIPPVG